MAKDLFSTQANLYAKYRPTYTEELFNYILQFVQARNCVWDCATGNGQAANMLADYFERVEATDISEAQLQNAISKANIHYSCSAAEQTSFSDNSFDLITVATAYHWFNWPAFYKEATRVGKDGCVVAVWSYHVFFCTDERVTALIGHFYHDIIKSYWDPERRYVDERYTTVEFEFDPLPTKDFDLVMHWTKEDFFGYLSTWSAVQHYIKKNQQSPLELIESEVNSVWPEGESKEFHFPLFLRIGRVRK